MMRVDQSWLKVTPTPLQGLRGFQFLAQIQTNTDFFLFKEPKTHLRSRFVTSSKWGVSCVRAAHGSGPLS